MVTQGSAGIRGANDRHEWMAIGHAGGLASRPSYHLVVPKWGVVAN